MSKTTVPTAAEASALGSSSVSTGVQPRQEHYSLGGCWWGRGDAWAEGRAAQKMRSPHRITAEAALLCFVPMKHQTEQLCWSQDGTRSCLGLHSFKIMPWIPPKGLSASPASLSTAVSKFCRGAAPLCKEPTAFCDRASLQVVTRCRHRAEHVGAT